MNSQAASTAGSNGESSIQDLFALTDEQILEIAPEAEVASREDPVAPAEQVSISANSDARSVTQSPATSHHAAVADQHAVGQGTGAQPEMAVPLEPPAWLAAQMQDPWGGEEAREFWNGVQQARTEAAAYRSAFATPEDARALKELYPGGVSEARTAADRARLLDEVDRAYFGAAGNSPEQTSATRAQLAQRMLREDPAAFHEMVETGLKVLQEAARPQSHGTKSLASAVSDAGQGVPDARATTSVVVAQHAAPLQGNQPNAATASAAHNDAHVAAYAAFERAANEDLERSVGGAIERTLAQALPASERGYTSGQARRGEQAGTQHASPLRERLAASVRADVEKALQGDRQLGEQVAQILVGRRFDNDARAQIVRLIAERAQQLVPGAAKRVLNEWTQTTLAAHRGRTQREESASAKADVALASVPAHPVGSERTLARRQDAPRGSGQASAGKPQAINYRKLSDEQILEM
jgi:hypothetical protein